MKKSLLSAFMLLTGFFFSIPGYSQAPLAPDQNPNFAVSRDKYMKIADSLNAWHSTTLQENYKAIDWLEDRREARADRREFRRQLRLERARYNDVYYYDDYNYSPYNNHYRRGSYNNYYNNRFNRGNRFYINPWGLWYWWR
ncbi:MAG: hypothetical protein JNK14_18330 [Chitinophagaceae bacterium]|nr:hypothetical protein [Chitinophagaceae bacterium]